MFLLWQKCGAIQSRSNATVADSGTTFVRLLSDPMWGDGGNVVWCPAGRAPYAGGDHFAWSSRWSAQSLFASPSERHTKSNTCREVTAVRAGRFFGADAVFLMLGLNLGHHCYGHYTHHGTRGAAAQFTQH